MSTITRYLWTALAIPLAACGMGIYGEGDQSQRGAIRGGTPDPTNALNLTVNVNGNCSGTLITNAWVLTANHCLQSNSAGNVTLALNQPNQQFSTFSAANIVRLPCNSPPPASLQCQDALLLKLDMPFTVNGSTVGFVRSQFPLASSTLAGTNIQQIGFGGTTNAIQTFAALNVLRVDVDARNPLNANVRIGDMLRWNCSPSSPICPTFGDSGGGGFRNVNGTVFQTDIQAGQHDLNGDGAITTGEIFALATSTPSIRNWMDSSLFAGWGFLGNFDINSGIGVSSQGVDKLDVFFMNSNSDLIQRRYDSGWIPGTTNLGRPPGLTLVGAPAAVSWSNGRIDVFVRASDNFIWQRFFDGGQWQPGWFTIHGPVSSSPAVSSWAPGRIDVFARGLNNELRHGFFDNSWAPIWENLGDNLASAPSAVSWSNGRIDVFARGTGNDVRHKFFENGWSAWESLGGNMSNVAIASSWGPGRLDVFGCGTNGRVMHRWFDGGTWVNDWIDTGFQAGCVSTPAVKSWGPGRIDIFMGSGTGLIQLFFPKP